MSQLRVAVISDFVEERWPSMQLVGEMIFQHVAPLDGVRATMVRPKLIRRFSRDSDSSSLAFNTDRLLNRMLDYPRYIRSVRDQFDVFHIVDHAYAQLVHELPTERTVVTCHDLDTFRCILQPELEHRWPPFRAMTRRVLNGLRRSARVVCNTNNTRSEVIRFDLAEPDRVSVVNYGINPNFLKAASALKRENPKSLPAPDLSRIELLHVGSTIPRKRIDILLQVFAGVRKVFNGARLCRVGGEFTREQETLARELQVEDAIRVIPLLDNTALISAYGESTLTLLPSDAEGFGIPIIESMACGTPVVASDIAAIREAGADCALYAPPGDVATWVDRIVNLLKRRETEPGFWQDLRGKGLTHAAKFSWEGHALKLCDIYRELSVSLAGS